MKFSQYNYLIQQKSFVILYNSFSDKFLGISPDVAKLFSAPDAISILKTSYPSLFEQFSNLGYIIDDEFDELKQIEENYIKAKFESKQLYLMVFPTQDCNLKCWYCYESHKAGTRMSTSVIENIQKHIDTVLANGKYNSVRLGFFGGEPLLDFEKIAFPLAIKIKQICEKFNCSFASFFVTNASLMNEQMIHKLSLLNPYFQITLDGDKTRHDKIRIWKKDNGGTYDQIVASIRLLCLTINDSSFTDDPLITLRINYDNQTLEHISGLLDDLKGIDKAKVRIHFERVWQTRASVNEEQKDLLMKTFARFIKEGFIITHGVFRRKNIACPSDSNSFYIVNYDGSIHKCNGRTLNENTQEGVLSQTGEIHWNEDRYDKRMELTTYHNPNCMKCKMLPLCMGPCTQKMLEVGGFSPEICSKHSIDVDIEEYLTSEFEMRYFLEYVAN